MYVPFMNLARQHQELKAEFLAAFDRVLQDGNFILGKEVEQFEADFAAFQGVEYCVGVSSGTTALHLALTVCGVGPGDEVITVPNSFAATAEAIVHCGARPVFVDIDPETCLMDPSRLEGAITSRTKAILPVHLYGCPAPLEAIMEIADRHGLAVVEDAAQAHGAELFGKRVGSFGRAAAFSFYPGKNLGALGDGGAVVTNDPELHRKLNLLRNHGSPRKYIHELVGYNYRMDALTGAVLRIKLRHLERWNEQRRERARLYREALAATPAQLPVEPRGATHVYHLFVVQVDERQRVIEELSREGVQTNIHYPMPLHLQPAFSYLGCREGDFPMAERAARRVLSLPMCPELSAEELAHVARQFIRATGIVA